MRTPPKTIAQILDTPPGHWVGDGFPVRGMFGPLAFTPEMTPFLMLDYAGPAQFLPTDTRRGVDGHPHKGFETVTIVYAGEVEHHDSAGNHGTIGPGDVQWMTAGAGILHKEYHSRGFAKSGGLFEMVQLWVNLPARDKHHPPRYQPIMNTDIPVVTLPGDAGHMRIIAGSVDGIAGPAQTFTPINVWDVRLNAGRAAELTVPEHFNTSLFVIRGSVALPGGTIVSGPRLVVMDQAGTAIPLLARESATLLVLNGQRIEEPIVAHGPFVMNSTSEIRTAMMEFQRGAMGHLD